MGLLLFLKGLHKGKPVGGLQLIPLLGFKQLLKEQCSRAGETGEWCLHPCSFPSGHPSTELGAARAQPWTLCEQEMCSVLLQEMDKPLKAVPKGLCGVGGPAGEELLLQSQLSRAVLSNPCR